MSFPDLLGTVGVSLLLLAYFLNLYKLLDQQAKSYILLNLIGAGLAGTASWLIGFYPFVVLEGTWVLVSGIALFKRQA
jgi:hypothetical protein